MLRTPQTVGRKTTLSGAWNKGNIIASLHWPESLNITLLTHLPLHWTPWFSADAGGGLREAEGMRRGLALEGSPRGSQRAGKRMVGCPPPLQLSWPRAYWTSISHLVQSQLLLGWSFRITPAPTVCPWEGMETLLTPRPPPQLGLSSL